VKCSQNYRYPSLYPIVNNNIFQIKPI